jgi:hypothetical protein
VTSAYESWIDRQIREAQERGEFDALHGTGKPLPDRGELYDENWWLKQLIEREKLTGLVPESLRIRKDIDDLPERLRRETSEVTVRSIVADLNRRIELARRGMVDGPPVIVSTLDVDEVVAAWRAAR